MLRLVFLQIDELTYLTDYVDRFFSGELLTKLLSVVSSTHFLDNHSVGGLLVVGFFELVLTGRHCNSSPADLRSIAIPLRKKTPRQRSWQRRLDLAVGSVRARCPSPLTTG